MIGTSSGFNFLPYSEHISERKKVTHDISVYSELKTESQNWKLLFKIENEKRKLKIRICFWANSNLHSRFLVWRFCNFVDLLINYYFILHGKSENWILETWPTKFELKATSNKLKIAFARFEY